MAQKLTCGVIISDGEHFLSCVPFGQPSFRDLPKGRRDPGEAPIDAAVREVKEETGLDINKFRLKDLGSKPYTNGKRIHLFYYKVDKMPDINKMTCSSKLESGGRMVPEMVGYEIQKMGDFSKMYPKLRIVLEELFSETNNFS